MPGFRRPGLTGGAPESSVAGNAHTLADSRGTQARTDGLGSPVYLLATMSSRKRVGVVGVSGYGGGEILRLCAQHPAVDVVYAAGESSAGQRLGGRYPGLAGSLANLTIQAFDPRTLPDLDLLFLSLPTGESRTAAALLPADLK